MPTSAVPEAGTSGQASTLCSRTPAASAVVMACAIDRGSPSISCATIQDLEAVGVDLYLNQQHLDTVEARF
jgi:hypothetical protein